MKKFFKILGILILILIIVFLILGLTQPKDITIVRTTTIKAPQQVVFNQISRFRNWPNWSPWLEVEPTTKMTYIGIDGQVGSSYKWLGDETGEGQMTNTGVTYKQMDYDLLFIKPWEGHAKGFIKAIDLKNGNTEVTWSMTMHSDFPMNALGFMTDRMVGKDFENGLELLKDYAQAHPTIEISMNSVEEKSFPATTYATIRGKIKWTDMQTFSTSAFATLKTATEGRRIGAASTFYYAWEDSLQTTDMAPAYAVSGTEPIAGVQMVNLPPSISCSILYKGGYANLGKANQVLAQYIAQKGRRLNYVIEEYLVGPETEPDSNKWVTNINFLVK